MGWRGVEKEEAAKANLRVNEKEKREDERRRMKRRREGSSMYVVFK